MMTSKDAARYKRSDKLDKGKLLNEIKSLSKALDLDKIPSKSSIPVSKHSSKGQSSKDKKSFWNWKPLKALSHVRNRRFNCCFTLDIHTIKGLPSKFNGTSFCVHWKRRDGGVVTSPVKVVAGVAEFEKKLTHTCSVYGSRSGPHQSAKYEAKHFLLYAELHGNPKLDLGKHRVDLTRLLPLTLEELDDKKSSGTWTTTIKLSGEATGAIMDVSFGYIVLRDNIAPGSPNSRSALQHLDSKAWTRSNTDIKQRAGKVLMQRSESLPVNLKSSAKSPVDVVKVLHEVPPTRMLEFSDSVTMLYELFVQEDLDSLVEDKCEIVVSGSNGGKPVISLSHSSLSDSSQDNMVNDENSEYLFIEEVGRKEKSTLVKDGIQDVNDQNIISSDSSVDFTDINICSQQEVGSKINEIVDSSHFVPSNSVLESTVNDKSSELLLTEEVVEFSEKSALAEDGEKAVDQQGIRGSDLPLVYSDAGDSCQEAEFERHEIINHDFSSNCPVDYTDVNICGQQEAGSKINMFVESSHFVPSDSVLECPINDKSSKLLITDEGGEFSQKSVLVEDGLKAVDQQGISGSDLLLVYSDAGASSQEDDFERDEIIDHDFSFDCPVGYTDVNFAGQQEAGSKIHEFVESPHFVPSDSLLEVPLNDNSSELLITEEGVEFAEKSVLAGDKEKAVDEQELRGSNLPLVYGDARASCHEADIERDEIKNHNFSFDYPVDYTDVNVCSQQEPGSKINEFVESSHFVASDSVLESPVNEKSSELLITEEGGEFSEKSVLAENEEKAVDEQGIRGSDLPLAYSDAGASCQEADVERDEIKNRDFSSAKENLCSKESILEDLELVLRKFAELAKKALDSPDTISEVNNEENVDEDGPNMMLPPFSLDDPTDNVADEFLSVLGIEDSCFTPGPEGEPESPRERLLREFEKETGCSLFGFGIDEEFVEEDDRYCAPTISGWKEFDDSDYLATNYSEYPKIRARMMEEMETQTLMQESSLDENAFLSSRASSGEGFGSPIDHPLEETSKLPPLGEGLGPFIQTKSGGFLRSMNPTLFKDATSGGRLIMQVSSPVVVPAELGSGVMDIVQQLASMGVEKLSIQANKLMPLEDITGRTMQQIAWQAAPHLEASESQMLLQHKPNDCHLISKRKNEARVLSGRKTKNIALDDVDSEFVCLEELAPLAIDKIEALSIEGLKIQSGISDMEAPSNIIAQSSGAYSDLKWRRVTSIGSRCLDGAVGLKLLVVKDSEVADDDGLMGLSLTLDEWMRLDSGEIDEDERLNERTSKLLAAHHAKCTDLNSFIKGERKQGRRCGLLGNNFTVALRVQLRDPLRDYELVGTPMLALIEVERVFVPPKPKLYRRVSEAREDNNGSDDDLEPIAWEEKKPEAKNEKVKEEDLIPQYKISGVHISGFENEPSKKKLWGSAPQQQSGSRWLLANGMGKGSKTPLMKPKSFAKSYSLPTTNTSQPGDTLWSISARYSGSGAKWKDMAAFNPHARNPNVILSNETSRLLMSCR